MRIAVMAETHLKAASRPLSPHLTIWRPTITYLMSGMHRITGAVLYLGMPFLAWWLIAAASGPGAFDIANAFFGSWLGRLILFGYTWTLIHHMLGGLRHLIWDTGWGLDVPTASRLGWATIVGSIVLTFVVWIIGYALR